jgi:uncharacterized protein YceK
MKALALVMVMAILLSGCAVSLGVSNSHPPPDACIGSSRTSPCG